MGFWDGTWHQLDHMQTICTLILTDNHTNTSSLSFTGRMLFQPRPVYKLHSVLWHCWLGDRKSIWPVNIAWRSIGVVVVVVQLNHLIMQIQYQLTVASRTKADTSMTHRKAKIEDADMTELTSFIRNTALASHNDEQIITELDFRCIW